VSDEDLDSNLNSVKTSYVTLLVAQDDFKRFEEKFCLHFMNESRNYVTRKGGRIKGGHGIGN
jgi:hypothetical protein